MSEGPGPAISHRYLLDENVARSVGRVLTECGRETIESRTVVGPEAADQVVYWTASEEGLVLVSHDRDFKSIALGVSRKRLRESFPVIWLRVPEPEAAVFLQSCLPMIEAHLDLATRRSYRIQYIQVQTSGLQVRYDYPPCSDPGDPELT